jgi:hypothetical protein
MSASAERRPRSGGEDVIVALDRPADLLSVEPVAMLERDARIEPGLTKLSTNCSAVRKCSGGLVSS